MYEDIKGNKRLLGIITGSPGEKQPEQVAVQFVYWRETDQMKYSLYQCVFIGTAEQLRLSRKTCEDLPGDPEPVRR
jgi:hypothetical protein